MKIIKLLFLLLFLVFCKEKNFENSIIIERMQASSSASGTNPINIFKKGKYWKPETSLDGITIFFSSATNWNKSGMIDGKATYNEFSIVCQNPDGWVDVYLNGSYESRSNCSNTNPQSNRSIGVHVLYLLPSNGNGIEEVSFYKNNKKLEVVYPEPIEGEVTASSTLPNYPSYALFDGSVDFAWVEGTKSSGIGEFFQLKLADKVELAGIEIFNGYQRLDELFHKNGSVTELLISNGQDSFAVPVEDVQGGQRIFFSKPISGNNFKFTIQKVRRGKTWDDTIIAEVILLGKDGKRFTITDANVEKFKKSIEEQSKGTVLENLTNKAFKGELEEGRLDYVFRSNGSFVIWRDDSLDKRVLDGNWVILSADDKQAKIKIFGRDHEVLTIFDENETQYSETKKESSTLIFSDILNVTKNDSNELELIGNKIQISN